MEQGRSVGRGRRRRGFAAGCPCLTPRLLRIRPRPRSVSDSLPNLLNQRHTSPRRGLTPSSSCDKLTRLWPECGCTKKALESLASADVETSSFLNSPSAYEKYVLIVVSLH